MSLVGLSILTSSGDTIGEEIPVDFAPLLLLDATPERLAEHAFRLTARLAPTTEKTKRTNAFLINKSIEG